MLIEAMTPLTVKLPSGDIRLTPGVAVDIPRVHAQRLLAKAPGKVREVVTDWLAAWRELASLTYGITRNDPRFPPVMAGLDACDEAYLSGDWIAFRQSAAGVRRAVGGDSLPGEDEKNVGPGRTI